MLKTSKLIVPEVFAPLIDDRYRYKIFYGGRGGAKSWGLARTALMMGMDMSLRFLCTREVQNSIKDSVHKLLSDTIKKNSLSDFYRVTNNSITSKINDTEFIFKGLRETSVDSVKSLEGIDICMVEEGQKVSHKSFEILTPTIRGREGSPLPFSQIWIAYNPLFVNDPVYELFVKNPRPRSYIKKVNYWDNPYFPDELRQEMEHLYKIDYASYLHIWEGEPISQGYNSVFSFEGVAQAMQREIEGEGEYQVGADIARYGDDRIVFFMRKGLKHIKNVIYRKLSITETARRLKSFVEGNKEMLIKVDDTGVGGGVTDILKEEGYNAIGVNFGGVPKNKDKYPNVASEMWFEVSDILPSCQLPEMEELKSELCTRQYTIDNKGRRVIESKEQYKEREKKSPDIADAFLLCYYNVSPEFYYALV